MTRWRVEVCWRCRGLGCWNCEEGATERRANDDENETEEDDDGE